MELNRLLTIEDMQLFPNAMELITEDEWKEFYIGDEEIGWMLLEKPIPYPAIPRQKLMCTQVKILHNAIYLFR